MKKLIAGFSRIFENADLVALAIIMPFVERM